MRGRGRATLKLSALGGLVGGLLSIGTLEGAGHSGDDVVNGLLDFGHSLLEVVHHARLSWSLW